MQAPRNHPVRTGIDFAASFSGSKLSKTGTPLAWYPKNRLFSHR